MKRWGIILSVLLVAPAFPTGSAWGQTASGKISGKVTDAETGDAIIGANVVLLNTALGASTDVEGEYVILNVVPGTYAIRVSYIGYQTTIMENIRVVAGITQVVNVAIRSAAVELGDVIIVAERKLFEEKATNDVRVYDSEQIASLPVRGVEKVLSIQAGVVTSEGSGGVDGNATVNIRGGRGNEVLYVVDGVPQNDLLTGQNYSQVSVNAVEQVSFQIGGYEAKYGQAQSGIVNVTTKTGDPTYSVLADVLSSELTDSYGYNLYSGTLSGPIIPGVASHTVFLALERGWFADGTPSAIGVRVPTVGLDSKTLPNNEASVWRFTGRTYHDLDFVTLRLGANLNEQKNRTYIHRYVKNNSKHNPRVERQNYSYTARFSRPLSKGAFVNLNVGMRNYREDNGDGVHFKNIERYGDPAYNPGIPAAGTRVTLDNVGIFFAEGRVQNLYTKTINDSYTADLDLSAQIDDHLLEIGGGVNLNRLRYFSINPVAIAINSATVPLDERARGVQPLYFGFDVTGQRRTESGELDPVTREDIGPRKPVIAYGYLQDRYELQDLVLNLGVRFDYFDTKAQVLRDETLPYAAPGSDPALYDVFDPSDFVTADAEFIVSPRIGLGFPVTATTVFHAQFGKFVQQPRLIDMYTNIPSLEPLYNDQNLGINTGHLRSEQTTQYELGFRQILGDNLAALRLTLFYKNTRDLVNTTTRFFYRQPGGQQLRYYGPSNADFGTVKGLSFTFDVTKLKNFSISVNYTFSLAEGTGSSTNSSFVAAFRNQSGETPIVIAPLDFDQRHTGTVNIGFSTGKDEYGVLENVSATLLASFNSGRPYTPLESQNLLAGQTNFGDTKGYVNSATGPGNFSINLRLEKSFYLGKLALTPYVWVENLLDADNVVTVYQSTGDPYTTGFLQTPVGIASAAGRPDYVSDYIAFERDPGNFGVPRQIRLGLRAHFSGVTF